MYAGITQKQSGETGGLWRFPASASGNTYEPHIHRASVGSGHTATPEVVGADHNQGSVKVNRLTFAPRRPGDKQAPWRSRRPSKTNPEHETAFSQNDSHGGQAVHVYK